MIVKEVWPDAPHHILSKIKMDGVMSALTGKPCIDLIHFDNDVLPTLLPGYDPFQCTYQESPCSMSQACEKVNPNLAKLIDALL